MESKSDIVLTQSEQEQIEEFRKTYNAIYIKKINNQERHEMVERRERTGVFEYNPEHYQAKVKYAIGDNPILRQLVLNMILMNPVNPQLIEGPSVVYKIVSDVGKRTSRKTFYLFGETHQDTRGHCPSDWQPIEFHNYIELLSRRTHSFVDLYVEIPMLTSTKPVVEGDLSHYDINLNKSRSSFAIENVVKKMYDDDTIDFQSEYISELTKTTDEYEGNSYTFKSLLYKYQVCIQPSTRTAEKCQLMRIHNIDTRSEWSSILPSYLYFYSEVLFYSINTDKTPLETINLLRRIGSPIQKVLEILVKPDAEILDSIIELFKTNPSIQKEVDERTYLKDEIESFIKNKIAVLFQTTFPYEAEDYTSEDKRIANFLIILRYIQNVEKYTLNPAFMRILISGLNTSSRVLLLLNALSMDMYALSRIFKVYKPKAGQPQNQPAESTNIIVYTGSIHIDTYRDFLKTLGEPSDEKYVFENTATTADGNSVGCVRMW